MDRVRRKNTSLGEAIRYYVQISCFLAGVCLFPSGYLLNTWNMMLLAVLFLFASNVLYCFEKLHERIVLLFFHLTMFTFLLSRPTISWLRGDVWWYFEDAAVQFSMNVLFIAMVALRIGAVIGAGIFHRGTAALEKKPKVYLQYDLDFKRALQDISLTFFLMTWVFDMTLGIEQMRYAEKYGYVAIYTSFESQYPYFFTTLSSMMKYGLCIFLGTMPAKKKAFIPLVMYFVSTIPSLVCGIRNPVVLAAIFIFLYYAIRDILGDEQRWIGKCEKMLIVIAVPLAIVFLGAYNYLRDGQESSLNLWETVVDFFYKQGVSFDVLSIGFSAIPSLPNVIAKNYTFGPFLDYLFYGSIGQKLLGTTPLGSGNSEYHAVYGNNFSHSMSYVAHDGYLDGHGWGSSFLLENYADWGYGGVIAGCVVLGVLLLVMMLWLRCGTMPRTITLICLQSVFFVPRAEATGWLLFLITLQFWLSVLFCYLAAGVFARRYGRCKRRLT